MTAPNDVDPKSSALMALISGPRAPDARPCSSMIVMVGSISGPIVAGVLAAATPPPDPA